MRLGILGAGQLGRMMALAAYPLGIEVRCFDPSPDPCAASVAPCITASYDDAAALRRFAEGLDVVTYEFENVPHAVVEKLGVEVLPPPAALIAGQDRVAEKSLFGRLGIATVPWAESPSGCTEMGFPRVIKTRRLGYDGKGQTVWRAADEAVAWPDAPSIVEELVDFTREVSIVAVRGRDRETRFYPLVENRHEGGILRRSTAPAPDVGALQQDAEIAASRVMDALDYVGVFAIEFFVHQGRLLANEMAPRVHNSGHWTIEGAVTSQFENHVRAVCGLPLGDTSPRGVSLMINLIGTVPDARSVLAVEGAHLHLYGKAPRAGRKLGHITIVGDAIEAVERKAAFLAT